MKSHDEAPKIFQSPKSENPFFAIARHLDCEEEIVSAILGRVYPPEWADARHLDDIKKNAHAANRLVRALEATAEAMAALSPDFREDLVGAGVVTLPQIQYALQRVNEDSKWLATVAGEFERTGGRNPGADLIAEGLRLLFQRLRRPVTWGIFEGHPTGEFCRAVEFSIAEFGIRAGWRGPADRAYRKHLTRQNRLSERKIRKHTDSKFCE